MIRNYLWYLIGNYNYLLNNTKTKKIDIDNYI